MLCAVCLSLLLDVPPFKVSPFVLPLLLSVRSSSARFLDFFFIFPVDLIEFTHLKLSTEQFLNRDEALVRPS